MIKEVIEIIGAAGRKIFSNWGATFICLGLYLALLAVLYFFFTTREATTLQVVLSVLILPLGAIVSFFLLQTMGLSYVRIGVGPAYLFKRALKDSWKLVVVSLPLILLIWLIIYLTGLAEAYLLRAVYSGDQPVGVWRLTALNWALIFLLFFVVPLIAIHLWIATTQRGLSGALRGAGQSLARAFSPRSVLIYLLVVVVFGLIAYMLFFTRTPIGNEWVELWVFGIRLAAALLTIFLGWLLTLGSIAELTARRAMSELET